MKRKEKAFKCVFSINPRPGKSVIAIFGFLSVAMLMCISPSNASTGTDIPYSFITVAAVDYMAQETQYPFSSDLLARGGNAGGNKGRGKKSGSGSGQCDGTGAGQGKGKSYGPKDGSGNGNRPQDGSGYGPGSGTGECPRNGTGSSQKGVPNPQ